MKLVLIAALLWTFLDTAVIARSLILGYSLSSMLPLLLLVHSSMAVAYRLMTHSIFDDVNPPYSHREFFYIVMIFYGPLGFPIVLLTFLSSGNKWFVFYEEFREYIRVKNPVDKPVAHDSNRELKRHVQKEPVIDAIRYGTPDEKRSATDILARIVDHRSIAALRLLARDRDPGIRFAASSKLDMLEKKFSRDMKWYGQIIQIFGYQPEIWVLYGNTILEYLGTGMVEPEMIPIYSAKAKRLFEEVLGEEKFHHTAVSGLAHAMQYLDKTEDAVRIIDKENRTDDPRMNDLLVSSLFELRKTERLRTVLQEIRNGIRKGGETSLSWLQNCSAELPARKDMAKNVKNSM